ncbi:TraB family [Nesidiocoris tenuis]|uniref:TraB family n=2 Tax=Nesidiocoris tenuis TaxID=355587 RepID=A0ABN7AWC0_9HEMI|nr:TraB family [Nesidiocoris tenuis]
MGGEEGVTNEESVENPMQSDHIEREIQEMNQFQEEPPPAIAGADAEIGVVPIEEFDASLPDTVALLRGPSGSKLYLVGTAHFSRESHDDVSKVIQTVKPHIVVVELCRSRAMILSMDENAIEEDVKNLSFAKMKNIMKEEGTLQGMLTIMLLHVSAKLTRDLGMAPGGEFRRAFKECSQLVKTQPCIFHFGDRPIQITIQRALHVLTWWKRLRLTYSLIFNSPKISPEEVEKCKQKDVLESLFKDMETNFPELGKVFIEERDTYLTYSLQSACNFSMPTGEPTVAVGVVGIAHMPGIKNMWGKIEEEQIPPILALPEKKGRGIVKKLIICGILTYAAVRVFRRFPVTSLKSLPFRL